MLFGFPFLAGILFDVFFVGISLSILNAYGVSRYKRMFGKGMLQAIVYRFFPPSHRFKGFPPSHIRYLFG
jgi:ABC-type glycerol-3-phosphate transport system permease component